jgi:hypothetical protein
VEDAPQEAAADEQEAPAPKIHVPDPELGREDEEGEGEGGENGSAPQKKRTRRGSRGGRNRRKKTPAVGESNGDSAPEAVAEEEPAPTTDDYVPMSEWIDDLDANRR